MHNTSHSNVTKYCDGNAKKKKIKKIGNLFLIIQPYSCNSVDNLVDNLMKYESVVINDPACNAKGMGKHLGVLGVYRETASTWFDEDLWYTPMKQTKGISPIIAMKPK